MNGHDSLCGWGDNNHEECFPADDCGNCEMIRRIRKDERSRWNTPYWSQDWHRGYRQGQADERLEAARKIIEYSEANHSKHSPAVTCIRCDITAAYKHAASLVKKFDESF